MANIYDIGDLVRITGTFTNSAGVVIDPTTVLFKHKDPSGNKTTLTYGVDSAVVRTSTGVYYVDLSVDEVGTWYYRWQSTGTGQSAGETYFIAQVSRL